MESFAIELRTLPIENLRPAPYNPRKALKPSQPAYKKLARSLTEFGLVEPLVWNELTGHVVGGHARLRILKEMGVREVPVSVVRLTEAREKALNIILNNQEAQGRYDPALLAELLTELEELPELELTGFGLDTLDALRLAPVEAPIEDDVPTQVEVVLIMSPAVYVDASAALDALVRRFDLTSHVRGPAPAKR